MTFLHFAAIQGTLYFKLRRSQHILGYKVGHRGRVRLTNRWRPQKYVVNGIGAQKPVAVVVKDVDSFRTTRIDARKIAWDKRLRSYVYDTTD